MLHIASDLLAGLHAHLIAGYPNEACGLLVGYSTGSVVTVVRIEPLENVADQPSGFESHAPGSLRNRYLVSPDAYVRVDRAAHAAGLDIIGVFHSHPDHPATPSAEDVRTAWAGLMYVIVSVHAGVAADTRAWRLNSAGNGFEADVIRPVPQAPARPHL